MYDIPNPCDFNWDFDQKSLVNVYITMVQITVLNGKTHYFNGFYLSMAIFNSHFDVTRG